MGPARAPGGARDSGPLALSGEKRKPELPQLVPPKPLVLVLRPGVLRCL